MYTTILLAVALQNWERYSAHALEARHVAASLVRGTAGQLYVLSVYDYPHIDTTGIPSHLAAAFRDEQMERIDASLKEKLAAYVAPLKDDGIQLSTILHVGNPRQAIVQVAVDIKADLLVIGSHSKRKVLDIALGGTAQLVSERSPCPVLLVAPSHSEEPPPDLVA